jgi:hypothetical protein
MSLATWSMTRRQNRIEALGVMPVGRLLAPGRWVARISMMPSAGPRLISAVAYLSNAAPWSGWLNASCASSSPKTTGCSGLRLRSGLEKGEDGEHAAAAICGFGQAEFHEDGAYV